MSKRNTLFAVSLTATYPSDVTPEDLKAGKRTDWDSEETLNVIATDGEDAIARAKAFVDKRDKADKSYADRLALVIDGVRKVADVHA